MPIMSADGLLSAGFTREEVYDYREQNRGILFSAGFSGDEIDQALGPEPKGSTFTAPQLRSIFSRESNVTSAMSKQEKDIFNGLAEMEGTVEDAQRKWGVAIYLSERSGGGISPQMVMNDYDTVAEGYFGKKLTLQEQYKQLGQILGSTQDSSMMQEAWDSAMKLIKAPTIGGIDPVASGATGDWNEYETFTGGVPASAMHMPTMEELKDSNGSADVNAPRMDRQPDQLRASTLTDQEAEFQRFLSQQDYEPGILEPVRLGMRQFMISTIDAVQQTNLMVRGMAEGTKAFLTNDEADFTNIEKIEDLYAQRMKLIETFQDVQQTAAGMKDKTAAGATKRLVSQVANSASYMFGAALVAPFTGPLFGMAKFPAGVMAYTSTLATGQFYGDMRERGIDPTIAAPVAIMGGSAYGAVENLFGFYEIPALTKKFTGSPLRKFILNFLGEWFEEGAQGAVESYANAFANRLNNEVYGGTLDVSSAQKVFEDALDQLWGSAAPVFLMSGMGLALTSATMNNQNDSKRDQALGHARNLMSERVKFLEAKRNDAIIASDLAKIRNGEPVDGTVTEPTGVPPRPDSRDATPASQHKRAIQVGEVVNERLDLFRDEVKKIGIFPEGSHELRSSGLFRYQRKKSPMDIYLWHKKAVDSDLASYSEDPYDAVSRLMKGKNVVTAQMSKDMDAPLIEASEINVGDKIDGAESGSSEVMVERMENGRIVTVDSDGQLHTYLPNDVVGMGKIERASDAEFDQAETAIARIDAEAGAGDTSFDFGEAVPVGLTAQEESGPLSKGEEQELALLKKHEGDPEALLSSTLKEFGADILNAAEMLHSDSDRTIDEVLNQVDMELSSVKWMASGVKLVPNGRQRQLDTQDDLDWTSDNPEVEEALTEAEGMKVPGMWESFKENTKNNWHKATRSLAFIPRTGEFSDAYEMFRIFQDLASVSQDKAGRAIAGITDILNPNQYKLFTRKVLMDNLVASVERGDPLRFNLASLQEATEYQGKLDRELRRSPTVQKAIENRRAIVGALRNDLVEYGILSEEQSKNWETYYRQQVLAYHTLNRTGPNGRTMRKRTPSFAKARIKGDRLSSEYDYNSDYIEAEFEYMSQAMYEIGKEQLLRDLKSRYGIDVKGDEMMPEGYAEWQPRPGNMFYEAYSIPEQLVEQLEKHLLETMDDTEGVTLTKDDLRKVLAVGSRRPSLVLPAEIVDQLESMEKPSSSKLGWIFQDLLGLWKVWTLFNPKRALAYMLRNLTGDFDPVFAAEPGVVKYTARAIKELKAYYSNTSLAVSADLQKARDFGVIRSSLTANEIPDLQDLAVFKRFYANGKTGLMDAPKWYFDKVKGFNEFREGILRYAAYLHYRDKIAKGKSYNFGGSRQEVVQGITDPDMRAAHLARNLLGDYGDLTVMGQWLRKNLIPFYSWMEVNTKRYKNLTINAFQEGAGKGAVVGAAATAAALLRMGTMYMMFAAFNRLMHPDEEEDLGSYDRANPHIIFGRSDDGRVIFFRNVGALGDFIEWFGLNDFVSLYPQWKNDQVTGKYILEEMGKAPINKVVGSLRPELDAGLIGLIGGQSTFPDVFNWRQVERDTVIPSMLGLRDEYAWTKNKLFKTGDSVRPGYLTKLLFASADPRAMALGEMYDLREKFFAKKGKPIPNFRGLSKYRNMRYAAQNGDQEAFVNARRKYLEDGGNWKNFQNSVGNLDPIKSKLNPQLEYEFEHEFLDDKQRRKLRVVRDYANELEIRMIRWWVEAMKEDPNSQE